MKYGGLKMFSERLRLLREEKGLKQSDLADYLGVSIQNVSYYERGREPNYDTLNKIADFFKVSTDYLTGRSDLKSLDEAIKLSKTNDLINDVTIDMSETPKKSLLKQISSIIELSNFLYKYDPKFTVDFYNEIKGIIDLYYSLINFVENQKPVTLQEYRNEIKDSLDYYPNNDAINESVDNLKKKLELTIMYSRYLALEKKCPELLNIINSKNS